MIKNIWSITFQVSDLRKATDFYENVLGLERKYSYSSYAGFQCGNVEIGLIPKRDENAKPKSSTSVQFLVDDVDRTWSQLRAKGIEFTKELHDEPWGGREASFEDLDGNIIEIVEINWKKYFETSAKGAKDK